MNGQDKCPKCGSTDIVLNADTGLLRCNFCRYEFELGKLENQTDLSQLQGEVVGAGASDVVAEASGLVTLKCESCGAEVVVDTASSTQARCHWCRNTLSVNQQIPNGAIPDVVLPFAVTKDEAMAKIKQFVGKRSFFAHPGFRKEFTAENVMGVYLPYMAVDINTHVKLSGSGEQLKRKYTRELSDGHSVTLHDADLYHVERDFDLTIQGLTVESSADKLDNSAENNRTNNVINSIMPFDTENCVQFHANYLKGFTSEKRDVNVNQVRPLVEAQMNDLARLAANGSLKDYDRGVAWDLQQLNVRGSQWKSAYLPVWLYSYVRGSGEKQEVHYVAVNARTQETMGSVPLYRAKLIAISVLIEVAAIVAIVLMVTWIASDNSTQATMGVALTNYSMIAWPILLLSGPIFYVIMLKRYRNFTARHKYETETKTAVSNMQGVDQFIKRETGLTGAHIRGVNNTDVSAQSEVSKLGERLFDTAADQNAVVGLVKKEVEKGKKG